MKKIMKPAQKEIAEYISDFSSKIFNDFDPHVELKFEFNYGSEFDGSKIDFHLTDDEAKYLLNFIKVHLSDKKVKHIKSQIEKNEEYYDQNIEARDWENCDYFGNNINLLKFLANENS
jgi:hypothetical protein